MGDFDFWKKLLSCCSAHNDNFVVLVGHNNFSSWFKWKATYTRRRYK
jgi:hypothetical protein